MEEKLLAMLDKSRLFSPFASSFPAKVDVFGLHGYNFFITNCFRSTGKELRHFEIQVKSLLDEYIQAWTKIAAQDPKRKFDWEKHCRKTFNFFGQYDWEKIFDKIKDGKNEYDLEIDANNSKLKIKRFGNILAFDVQNQSSAREEHSSGTKAILSLCRAESPNLNQGVYELLHKIEVSLSLPGKSAQSQGYIYDFDSIFSQLEKDLYMVKWELDGGILTDTLIDAYRQDERVFAGHLYGFRIFAKLVHKQEEDRTSERIWRKGNVKHVEGASYQFTEGYGLRLKFTLQSSLPENIFDNEKDLEADHHAEQFRFAEAAALFCSRLCSMQLNKRLEVTA